jgi:hypothetical protein
MIFQFTPQAAGNTTRKDSSPNFLIPVVWPFKHISHRSLGIPGENANQSLSVTPVELYGLACQRQINPRHDIPPASPERERWRAGPTVFLVTENRSKAVHFVPQGTLSTFSASVPYDSQQTQCSDQLYLTINVKM